MSESILSLDDEEENLPQEIIIKLHQDSPYLYTSEKCLIGLEESGYRVTSMEDFLGERELTLTKI